MTWPIYTSTFEQLSDHFLFIDVLLIHAHASFALNVNGMFLFLVQTVLLKHVFMVHKYNVSAKL